MFLGQNNLRRAAVWILGTCIVILLIDGLGFLVVRDKHRLFQENGLIENLSVAAWGCSLLTGLLGCFRTPRWEERLIFAWITMLALLAGLRELDAHKYLNPESLGEFGVRFRANWWLDSRTPLWLKLGWGALFAGTCMSLIYPLVAARGVVVKSLREAEVRTSLLIAAFAFLGFGFFVDDLMRGSKIIDFQTRQMLEETTELIGAVLFLIAAACSYSVLFRVDSNCVKPDG
jgi:hypothetical protein